MTVPLQVARSATSGRFTKDNLRALKHGLHSRQVEALFQARREAFLAQSLADAGGADTLPVRVVKLHESRSRVQTRIEQLDNAISTLGVFDSRGRVRERLLVRLENLIALALRLDTTLGLERKPRKVPTVHDYLTSYSDTGDQHEHDQRDRDQRDPDPDRDRDEPA